MKAMKSARHQAKQKWRALAGVERETKRASVFSRTGAAAARQRRGWQRACRKETRKHGNEAKKKKKENENGENGAWRRI